MDHLEKLLEESCPNHACAIKQKLRDYSLMKSFMATRYLPRSMEVIDAPIEDDEAPFLGGDVVMTVFRRSSPPKKHRALNPRKGAPSHGNQRWGDEEM
jgi:hypothetical protein